MKKVIFYIMLLTVIIFGQLFGRVDSLGITVARYPVVLKEHFPEVPYTLFPRGYDILARTDTAQLVVYLRNNGTAPVQHVSAVLIGDSGISFESDSLDFDTLQPGACVGRLIGVRTAGASIGMHPIAMQILADAYASWDTLWLTVWGMDFAIADVAGGIIDASLSSPYAYHSMQMVGPEVFSDGLPAYFDMQHLTDTVQFTQPFYGIHYARPRDSLVFRDSTRVTSPYHFGLCIRIEGGSGNPLPAHVEVKACLNYVSCWTTDISECCIDVPTSCSNNVAVYVTFLDPDLKEMYGGYGDGSVGLRIDGLDPPLPPPPGQEAFLRLRYPYIPDNMVPRQSTVAQGSPKTWESIASGCGWGGGSMAIDVALALIFPPITVAAAMESIVASAYAGIQADVADDPDGYDLSWAGEENTPPQTPNELTLSEVSDLSIHIMTPLTPNSDGLLSSQFTFTRITDSSTYSWAGAETLAVPRNLFFSAYPVGSENSAFGIQPTDRYGASLSGCSVLAQAWFTSRDSARAIAQLLLHDDGQAPDVQPNDGLFSDSIPSGLSLDTVRLFVMVTRTSLDSPRTVTSVSFGEVAVKDIQVISQTLGLAQGWNMVSSPVRTANNSVAALFPGAGPSAFGYENGYHTADSLTLGYGYWLKFAAPETLAMFGAPVDSLGVDVRRGWNMIGSISRPIAVRNIISEPESLTVSKFFQYSQMGYDDHVDSIRPGMGYWVKAKQAGRLILSTSTSQSAAHRIIIVADAELPPPPPEIDKVEVAPAQFILQQNFPNPFNPTSVIEFSLPQAAAVTLKIFNLLGQEVLTLKNNEQYQVGMYQVQFDASTLPTGLYFYRLSATSEGMNFIDVKKMLLIK